MYIKIPTKKEKEEDEEEEKLYREGPRPPLIEVHGRTSSWPLYLYILYTIYIHIFRVLHVLTFDL